MGTLGNTLQDTYTIYSANAMVGYPITASENGIITNFYIWYRKWILNGNVKCCIYSSGGTLLSVLGTLVVDNTTGAWKHLDGLSFSIASGTSYWLTAVFDVQAGMGQKTIQPANNNWDNTNSYASPQSFGPFAKDWSFSLYIVYAYAGPSLKIEGITPGKLENKSWSELSDVL